mmetsp:Transcript_148000/g.368871  ORF Transcript_148000/g.368871 Transcript_148000/m.368871 type:complete len:563 (-) Transcript_148000:28-1716(-)
MPTPICSARLPLCAVPRQYQVAALLVLLLVDRSGGLGVGADSSSASLASELGAAAGSSVSSSGSASSTGLAGRVAARRGSVSTASALRASDPKSASFFGDFSEGESTFDHEVVRITEHVHEGFEPKAADPYANVGVHPAAWYHESQSAGARGAWQTHYPAITTGLAGRDADPPGWKVDASGRWIQEYNFVPSDGGGNDEHGVRNAGWFDASVRQLDGYGRPRQPMPETGRRLVMADSWNPQSVNTTLTCKDPGCTANSALQVFDPSLQRATHCMLSVFFHPTDFDDQYSGERVTFIKVNNVTVNTDCFPMVSSCNATTQGPMFACVRDLSLDGIVDPQQGVLDISAQISEVVDECPYQGNLLSGVPMVTCLVAPLPAPPPQPPRGAPVLPIVPPAFPLPETYLIGAPFRCPERGCKARAELELNQTTALPYEQCLLTVRVNQTDFDGEQGTPEQIEFIKINGAAVKKNISPGLNPCNCSGKTLSPAEIEYTALQYYDVTQNMTDSDGKLIIEVKITDFVDECALDGYLLSGRVEVNCTLGPPNFTNFTWPAAPVTPRSNLRI